MINSRWEEQRKMWLDPRSHPNNQIKKVVNGKVKITPNDPRDGLDSDSIPPDHKTKADSSGRGLNGSTT